MTSKPKSSWGEVFCSCLPWTRQPSSSDLAVPLNQVPPGGSEPRLADNTVQRPTPDSTVSSATIATGSGEPRPTDDTRQHSIPDPTVPSTSRTDRGAEPRLASNVAWGATKLAMEGLYEVLDVFPPLKMAVGGLLGGMTQLQVANRNRQEYEHLMLSLAHLAGLLQKHLSDSKPTYMPYSIRNVAGAIDAQVRHIQQWQGRSGTSRFVAANEDDDVLRCYRRVEALFQQLQADISLSIWDVMREEQMETRLQHLSPADDAWYNSSLTEATAKRRGCTANTRTKVLSDARDWTRDEEAAKVYWMNGMAGTGKTTIAYSFCEQLEDENQLGASFFCSRNSPNCRHVYRIVPTIAYQLGRYSNPYQQALCDALQNNPDVAKRDIKTQFENLIVKPLGLMKQAMPAGVVVVIDALDECVDVDGTKQVLDLLFRRATELPIKFFVTSRPEPVITGKMMHQNSSARSILHLHEIEQSFVQADIRTYLQEALAHIRPSPEDLEQLVARAGRLFIFAATAVRFISPDDEFADHGERLSIMLGATSDSRNQGYRDIDNLYSIVVANGLAGGNPTEKETKLRRRVLWTVVCAREPMTTSAIAEVLGVENGRKVEGAIHPLRSVLNMSDISRVVSTLHASFPDFLLSEARAGSSLYCDKAEHNSYLATRCFEVMKRSLRFNICELETSYRLDIDVRDLETRVGKAISPGLFYACRYWGDHLLDGATSSVLLSCVEEFLQYRLLFWMEVLSLKGWIGHGDEVLSQALSWLQIEGLTELRQLTHDARNFVTTFAANPSSLSTPHIYLSVLPFTSKQSRIWVNYWPRTQGLLRVEGTGMEARGRAALATWTVGSSVTSIAQSNDSKRIVSGSWDGAVSIWDVSNGARVVGPLKGHQGQVISVAFSSDGTRIASGSVDSTIRTWDARNGSLIASSLNSHTDWVRSVAFSTDGSRLVSGSDDHTLRLWDARDGSSLGEALEGHHGSIRSVAFSPDDKRIVSGSNDRTIRVWDSHTGVMIVGPFEGHTYFVRSVAFSRDGLRVVSGSDDHTVRVWEAHTGKMLSGPFRGHTNYVTSVAFSPDGIQVVSGSRDCTIRIWDSRNGELLAGPFKGHRDHVRSVLFSSDSTRILSGSEDGTIRVWDARHGTTAADESSGHTSAIYSVAFSPDGTRAVSGSTDRTIRIWNTRDGRLVLKPLQGHTGPVYSVAFSPDGARIVSGSYDRTLRTWDARTGTLLAGLFIGHTNSVRSVAFSPDGNRIVSGSDDYTIRVWDSRTGRLAVDPFRGHAPVVSVAFSPDGMRVVSGSWDETAGVRVWDVLKGTAPVWASDAHEGVVNCVAFSSDGGRVISGSDDCVILVLNALDGTVLHGPFKGHTGWVMSVAFSPDGNCIVSGSKDGTVCMWDAQNGGLVPVPFKGHASDVLSVAFSPDGRHIVSSSDDCTIRFWEVPTAGNPHSTYFNQSTLSDDGWVADSESQLLMWLPPDLRATPRPPCSHTITSDETIMADYSGLLIGEHWHKCYHDPSARTPS